jgi:hypothetical protein
VARTAESVSDPSSPDYNPRSPLYDVTADSSSKYYVGPIKTDNTPSGDEIREMATQQIDDEIRAGWLGPAVDPVLRDKKIQELYQQHLDNAKHGLDEGLAMRENGGAPRTLWNNASHEQMNDAITQDANPATVAETSEEWVAVGNDLGTHQKTLGDAINASTSNWQGDAGDAVREHLAGVGKWLGATAQGATLAGRQQEIHSQALNETQRQMAANPPVQFDLQSTNQRLMSMTDPVQYAAAAGEAMQTYRAQTAARDHAAQIMTQYDDTIGGAVATPRFPAPPKLPSATATPYSVGTRASGGAAASADQPLLARSAMDPALDADAAARQRAGLDAAALDGSGGAGGSGAGGSGAGGNGAYGGAGIPGGGSGAGGAGFSGSGIPGGGAGAGGSDFSGSGFSGSGIPGGGSGAGGSGAGGAGFTPPNFDAPGGPGGGSFSGAGIPGSSIPISGDGTTSSGFSPSGIGGGGTGGSSYTPPSIPNIPDISGGGGGGIRGGSPIPGFSGPGIDPITGLPTGTGPGGIPGGGTGTGKMPTIGRGGGINGESIASRLGGIGGGGAGGGSLGGIGGGGAGAGGAGGGVRGTGAGSLSGGAASGAAAEAEAAAARNAGMGGKAGAAGSPGMGGMGAGARGGKKEDDKEHKAADYLESDDPNFFAGEEAVAPPVIGDWKNQDWK